MELNVMGYNKNVDIDYCSGIDEMHKEAERLVREMVLPNSHVFKLIQNMQATVLEKYDKDFKLEK